MKNEGKSIAAELIKAIGDLYVLKIKKDTEALGVKNAYRPLLAALKEQDGGDQLSLAGRTNIKAPTVSITLRKMEKDGIVDRAVDESDLRRTHVFLTEKGRKLALDTEKCIADVNASFTAGMNKEQKAFFISSLEKIKESLK